MHTLIYIFSPLISLNGWAVECALVRSHTSYKIFPQVIKIWKFIIKFIIFWDKNDDERECNSNSSRKIARTNGRESGKKGERSVEWRKQQQRLPNRIWTDAKCDCSLFVSLTFYFTSLRSLRALHLWEQCNFRPEKLSAKAGKVDPISGPSVWLSCAHCLCVCDYAFLNFPPNIKLGTLDIFLHACNCSVFFYPLSQAHGWVGGCLLLQLPLPFFGASP